MPILHRKLLPCKIVDDDCHHEHPLPPPPPPPPPPPTSSDHSFSPFLIFMFCGLAVSFSFIFYLLFASKYRSRRQRIHEINTDETHEDFVNEDLGPVIHHHPIWLINTIGLDQSQIESIQIFKYKRDQGLIEGTDCSVCLSEFEDDESLRLLPKCSHAFHVPCIDTWLRSHKNCPLCRAPIISNTTAQTTITIDHSNLTESTTTEETSGEDNSETVDREINGEVEKSCGVLDETASGERAYSDLADHHRVRGDGLVAMRRSVSMDESSASIVYNAVANVRVPDQETTLTSQLVRSKKPNSITKSGHKLKGSSSSFHICSKIVKSSSFGHSSQKASSNITNKCPNNRSY